MGISAAARLEEAIKGAGVAISGLRIGLEGQASTVFVQPSNLQASAQAMINAFDWSQAAEDLWQLRKTNSEIGRIVPARLAVIVNSSVTTLADVGLGWQLDANRHYAFSFTGAYTAAATTTGIAFAVNGPASPVLVRMVVNIAETATTTRYGAQGAYETAVIGLNSAASTAMPFWIEGNISTGATPGRFDLRFRSEVNASQVSVLSGSYGLLYPVG